MPRPPLLERDGLSFVRPDYTGRGLACLAPTVLRLLAGEQPALPGLDHAVLPERLSDGVGTIVVLVADGFGHLQLEGAVAAANAPTLAGLLRRAAEADPCVAYAPITSVFPTTTVAALGSLNSAVLPVEHGLLGYTLWLQEYGHLAEMIRWGPFGQRGSFADPPFEDSPERFFWASTVYKRLRAAGVQGTYAVNPAAFAGTALTRMLHQAADYRGYAATSSVSVVVPRLLNEAGSRGPTYVYAYWPTIDTVAHVHGPASDEHSAEVFAFDAAFGRLLERLPARGDLLLLLTADHGHVQTGPEQQVTLTDHPRLLEMLSAPPAGERRAVYLHTQRVAEVVAYAQERLAEAAVAMTREEAVAEGLFGVKQLSARAASRIGEVLLFPRGALQIAPSADAPASFKGLHGGLSPEEALVPLLALRL